MWSRLWQRGRRHNGVFFRPDLEKDIQERLEVRSVVSQRLDVGVAPDGGLTHGDLAAVVVDPACRHTRHVQCDAVRPILGRDSRDFPV